MTFTGSLDINKPRPEGVDIPEAQVDFDVSAGHNHDGVNSKNVSAALPQHGIASATAHSSAITSGKMVKADANGLPAEGSNTDIEVASVVTNAVREGDARLTDARIPVSHGLADNTKHSSSATSGKMLKADANGLPVDASNTNTEVSGAVTASHARSHAIDSASDHSAGTQGDILYAGALGAWTRLGAGINGQILKSGGPAANPSWTDGIINNEQCCLDPVAPVTAAAGVTGTDNYVGATFRVYSRVQFNRFLFRLNGQASGTLPGVKLLIYQTANGLPGSAINLPSLKATMTVSNLPNGAQTLEATPSEGTVTLLPGVCYILTARNGSGPSFYNFTTPTIDLLTATIPTGSGWIPATFTTTIPVASNPATLDPRQVADGGALTASSANTAIVNRVRMV